MPLPDHPLIINGGCNCRAIRYKISIPALASRPLNPYCIEDNHGRFRVPMVAIDHCNDCRRATGSVLPIWFVTPIAYVTSSVILRSSPAAEIDPAKVGADQAREQWLPADDVFQSGGPASRDSFLTFYESSENRSRSFCGRCGTNLAYRIHPTPEGWPGMIDILLGTVDRESLNEEWLAPERQLWWECGLDWVRKFATVGAGLSPKHPSYKINELVE